jgi:hypothetical protein
MTIHIQKDPEINGYTCHRFPIPKFLYKYALIHQQHREIEENLRKIWANQFQIWPKPNGLNFSFNNNV